MTNKEFVLSIYPEAYAYDYHHNSCKCLIHYVIYYDKPNTHGTQLSEDITFDMTEDEAWKSAALLIEYQMLRKLEQ